MDIGWEVVVKGIGGTDSHVLGNWGGPYIAGGIKYNGGPPRKFGSPGVSLGRRNFQAPQSGVWGN